MKRKLLLFTLTMWMFGAYAQVIPSERLYQWNKAGLSEEIQEPSLILDITDYGGVGDGTTVNDAAFASAMDAANGQPAVIYFPTGTFRFEQRLNLVSGVILRGNSADSTILEFELTAEHDLINISGSISSLLSIAEPADRDDTVLVLENTVSIEPGDLILLYDDDADNVFSTWAYYATGQVVNVNEVLGDTLNLASELRRSYLAEDTPKVKIIEPIRDVSIENLKINRLDATTGQTSNVQMRYAYNCRLKCIESENSNFAHVAVEYSSNVLIEGSYFHHAFAYGGGGQGYGVALQYTTGECLVENNIFEHLRHSMLLQAGANGNVCAYNYSFDPFWSETGLPANSAGDAVLHGNYVYGNLFEGNIIQNIVIDDSHGTNGPYNAFFRNRAELYGIFMNNNPASNNQTFIGNEITASGFPLGNYFLNGTGHYEYGNNKYGTVVPSATSNLTVESLYRTSALGWYDTNSSWPPIGYPNTLSQYSIEALQRFDMEQYTACTEGQSVGIISEVKDSPIIYPNPASDRVYVSIPDGVLATDIYDLSGKLIMSSSSNAIDISSLQNGVYLLRIYANRGEVYNSPLIIAE